MDDTVVRETLFPASASDGAIQTATPGDADDIGGLMHQWARQGGMDTRRTERLVERWLHDDPAGFRMARDGDGRAVGVMGLVRVADRTVGSMEPLLQQHTDRLMGGQRARSLVLGAAYCPERGLHARLLRDLLHHVMANSLLLTVSTPNPHYQQLLTSLRFHQHGTTTDDVYRCGRKPEIYSQDFGHDGIAEWVGRLTLGAAAGGPSATGRDVGRPSRTSPTPPGWRTARCCAPRAHRRRRTCGRRCGTGCAPSRTATRSRTPRPDRSCCTTTSAAARPTSNWPAGST
ncbi:hypothetical protein ACFQ60_36800 [Streptomyces zhihengii]